MSYSIELLTKHRDEFKRCLEKSINSYKMGAITLELHNTHLRNLQPKIANLEIDINKLKA